ncbi:MAG: TfuA-related McrA-glycine thioamidation protein [Methanotrichaceae archaeon]|nr:TfuA-related McrA-glycine thioamidation protein [Methanotrichaceae archaeon]
MPRIVVFLGPSLPADRAREILAAEYRAPAKRGDIYRAALEGADVICLIDGVFFQDCSVAHKEILDALEMGSKVLGASSMGALRASEMDVYGMEGVGEIYLAYKRGDLISDDEVALIFDPIFFEPLSEPLVNIRHNLDIALQRGVIDEITRCSMLKAAQSRYFPERTYERMMLDCEADVSPEVLQRFREFINNERRDLKMEDAIKALERARKIANEG